MTYAGARVWYSSEIVVLAVCMVGIEESMPPRAVEQRVNISASGLPDNKTFSLDSGFGQ